ncbi:hypothetical protein NDU88_004701 [Pleurodeles waltl]|uniref:Uncharacterized protein n=1 Tax=Pleurodeles waltl TaxID=8319 RepID=A0AAV7VL26_PLEWA|nr:hypothetical protein NDU88_004701 [Pleurodeles waltl]
MLTWHVPRHQSLLDMSSRWVHESSAKRREGFYQKPTHHKMQTVSRWPRPDVSRGRAHAQTKRVETNKSRLLRGILNLLLIEWQKQQELRLKKVHMNREEEHQNGVTFKK